MCPCATFAHAHALPTEAFKAPLQDAQSNTPSVTAWVELAELHFKSTTGPAVGTHREAEDTNHHQASQSTGHPPCQLPLQLPGTREQVHTVICCVNEQVSPPLLQNYRQ